MVSISARFQRKATRRSHDALRPIAEISLFTPKFYRLSAMICYGFPAKFPEICLIRRSPHAHASVDAPLIGFSPPRFRIQRLPSRKVTSAGSTGSPLVPRLLAARHVVVRYHAYRSLAAIFW
jgi:hypothetical protein